MKDEADHPSKRSRDKESGHGPAGEARAETGPAGPADAAADAVILPVEDALDLHAFAPRDIPDVVEAYLEASAAKGFAEVRLIHGKGIGVQRERVQALLARHPLVLSFEDAPAERGHWGATLVRLRVAVQE